jgi:alkylation response protein AidB-like acyl-CoA dehydrogenase
MMRLKADDDAVAFGQSVAELYADGATSDALRAAWDSEDGRIPGLWARLADMGVLGALVPEEYGGLGLDLRSVLPVVFATGRAAVPEPIIETLVGSALLAAAGGAAAKQWLPAIAAGEAVVGLGLGPGTLVSGAQWADVFILRDPVGDAHVVEPSQVTVNPVRSVDAGIRLADVEWAPAPSTRLHDVNADDVLDLAIVAAASQLVGLAQTMLDLGVNYALQREQFGKVIGSFQAVKHQLADVYVATSFARPVVARAAWSVATNQPSSWRDASHAKFAAGRAAKLSARAALQVHAGIGYTYEHDLHMYMKRTWSLTSLWGDQAWHRTRVADAVLEEE